MGILIAEIFPALQGNATAQEVLYNMKKITMFMQRSCPYCREAGRLMEELLAENENYRPVEVEVIDELAQPELADSYDYHYVPTYYVGEVKLHEGAATKENIRRVYEAALAD